MNRRQLSWLFLALLLTVAFRPVPLQARAMTVDTLWLDVSMGRPLLPWFNDVARPNDIARIENLGELDMLDQLTAGRRMVVFKSVAEAERQLPLLADRLDIVGYNIETGPLTPADEQGDPVAAIARLSALADRYGLLLALGPDRRFALSHGVAMAPFADIFVFQIQRQQTRPEIVRDYVLPLAPQLLRANPTLELTVQVRSEGDIEALVNLLETLKGTIDGVSLLTSPDSIDVAVAFVNELRSRSPLPPPTHSGGPAALATSFVATGAPTANTTAAPGIWLLWLLCALFLFGGLLIMVVALRLGRNPAPE